MKLRIRGSSIRLRLSQAEVARFTETDRVDDAIAFGPGQRLTYSLVAADVSAPTASFDVGVIVVSLPRDRARAWATGDDVSIDAKQHVAPDETLSILVEKDFACLAPRTGEDDTDAFPNPRGAC
jgi:hypothetical protein